MEATKSCAGTQPLFVGIDVHKKTYYVTGIDGSGVELFSTGIPAEKGALLKFLGRYGIERVEAVYEAGYFGYDLHDTLIENGAECLVTPPSLVPTEYGNRVKTDRRDSRKLAMYLQKGLLKRVHVPTAAERGHRQVVRTRHQVMKDRQRKQCQIKSYLVLHGIPIGDTVSNWSARYVAMLHSIRFGDRWLQGSFQVLLDAYEFSNSQVIRQTKLLSELAKDDYYRDRVAILESIHGIGVITAMELLVEVQEVERFRTGDKLAAYVGLTPSQYSSGEKVRMGRITRVGKPALRAALIEAAWTFGRKDARACEQFEAIARRAGKKRANVAIARRLLIIMRSMLINKTYYISAD